MTQPTSKSDLIRAARRSQYAQELRTLEQSPPTAPKKPADAQSDKIRYLCAKGMRRATAERIYGSRAVRIALGPADPLASSITIKSDVV